MEVSHHTVTDADTAERLGSGDMPVLATPRLINWIERAAFGTAAEDLEPGSAKLASLIEGLLEASYSLSEQLGLRFFSHSMLRQTYAT